MPPNEYEFKYRWMMRVTIHRGSVSPLSVPRAVHEPEGARHGDPQAPRREVPLLRPARGSGGRLESQGCSEWRRARANRGNRVQTGMETAASVGKPCKP